MLIANFQKEGRGTERIFEESKGDSGRCFKRALLSGRPHRKCASPYWRCDIQNRGVTAAYCLPAIVLNMVMEDFRVPWKEHRLSLPFSYPGTDQVGGHHVLVPFQSCKGVRVIFKVLRALSSLVFTARLT